MRAHRHLFPAADPLILSESAGDKQKKKKKTHLPEPSPSPPPPSVVRRLLLTFLPLGVDRQSEHTQSPVFDPQLCINLGVVVQSVLRAL